MKLKVLHLISSTGFFGAENVVVTLALEQARLGLDARVGVFRNSSNPYTEVAEAAEREGVKSVVFDCSGKFDAGAVMRIRAYIKEEGIGLVHSHGYKSNFYALLAAKLAGVKAAATCHNWTKTSGKMIGYMFLDRFLLRRFDIVSAVSEQLRSEVLKSGVPAGKVKYIPNGIDTVKFAPTGARGKVRSGLGIQEDAAVIGSLGRMSVEKGYGELIEALPSILEEVPGAVLLLAGEGPDRPQFEAAAAAAGVSGKVIFAGMSKDASGLLEAMDVFILPSRNEGMPLALLEAMAAGKPVIATGIGAIPAVITSGSNGILIAGQHPGDIAGAVKSLLKDRGAAARMAAAGRETVKGRFSAREMAEQFISLYGAE